MALLCFKLGFIRSKKGRRCSSSNRNVLHSFVTVTPNASDSNVAQAKCEKYCSMNTGCWGCSISCDKVCQWNAIDDCGVLEDWGGVVKGGVTQKPGKIRNI